MSYPRPWGTLETHYSPVRHSTGGPKPAFAFDLHVLAMPPAFNLSQDQTLQLVYCCCGCPTNRVNTIASIRTKVDPATPIPKDQGRSTQLYFIKIEFNSPIYLPVRFAVYPQPDKSGYHKDTQLKENED